VIIKVCSKQVSNYVIEGCDIAYIYIITVLKSTKRYGIHWSNGSRQQIK